MILYPHSIFTLVHPCLNYCIHVWGRAYNTHLKDLFVLRNKVIRIINGVPPRTNTEYLYIKQSVLTVKRLCYYNIRLFMYKYSNGMLPEMFNIYFDKLEYTHPCNTRKSVANHLYVDFRSTSRGQKFCICSSSIIWNFILDNLDPNCAIGSFKKQSHLYKYMYLFTITIIPCMYLHCRSRYLLKYIVFEPPV